MGVLHESSIVASSVLYLVSFNFPTMPLVVMASTTKRIVSFQDCWTVPISWIVCVIAKRILSSEMGVLELCPLAVLSLMDAS